MRRSTTALLILFLIVVGIGGFLWGRAGMFPFQRTSVETPKIKPDTNGKTNETEVVVFFLKPAAANFYLKPVLYRVRMDQDLHIQALNALFAGPSVDSKLLPLFPKDTKVLNLTIKKGIAYLNLSSNVTELNVGASTEKLAVASLVNTLTKFPDVFRVKILVEGKEVESLAGHVDLSGPLGYNDQVIDPELF
jgi:spore germination protein GerM